MIQISNTDLNCKLNIEYTKTNYQNSISYVYLVYNLENPTIEYIGCFNSESVLPLDTTLKKDGYYTISSLTLIDSTTTTNGLLVYCNGSQIYIYSINGELVYLEGEDLKPLSNEMILNILLNNEIENIQNINYISICFLKQCYISISLEILNSQLGLKCKVNSPDMNDLIYRRDLVWMAINVISYLVEFCQLYEALRVIELLSTCNGICKNEYKATGGCGCS